MASSYLFKYDWTKPVVIEPIVRIKPELGIQVTVSTDENGSIRATEAYAGAGMFRGFEIFMRNKPAPDIIMLSSRECGICGEHHQFIERIAQEMAMGGYAPPPLGLETIMLANDAAMMYDHTAHLTALGGPDWSSLFFKIAGYYPPDIYQLATQTPISKVLDYSEAFPNGAPSQLQFAGVTMRTVADIMDGLVPIIGAIFLEGAYVWRIMHEAELLYYLRIPHPITMVPGGIGVPATVENLQAYLQRLIDGTAYMKKQAVVWEVLSLFLNDYDNVFGVQAYYDTHFNNLGFAELGNRPANFVSYGQSDVAEAPEVSPSSTTVAPYDATYENAGAWGRARVVKPGLVIQPSLTSPPQIVTNSYIDINLAVHEFVESSFQADWTQSPYSSQVPSEVSGIEVDPIGNKVNAYHPWKKWTIPTPLARGYPFGSGNQYGKYSWGVSPRFVPYQGHKPISSYFYNVEADPMGLMYAQVLQGSAPEPIYTATYSIAGIEIQYGNASNQYVKWNLPQTISPRVVLPQELQGEIELNYLSPWQITNGKFITNAVERMRARAFAVALEAAGAWVAWFSAVNYIKNGQTAVSRGNQYDWEYKANTNTGVAIGVGMKEAPRGAQYHANVIATGKGPNVPAINPQQMQPTTVNLGPRVKNSYDDGIQTVSPAPSLAQNDGAGTFEETIQGNKGYNIPGSPKLTVTPLEQWDGFEFAAALRSFDPCFVCGVHVVLPNGKVRYLTLGAPIDLSEAIKAFYKFAMKVK
ncbi:Ni Fe-hydrogenase I large subunit [Sulfolobus sp. A20]|uniref:nickel-dependent hydrogenase large subunit n=1 Tax=Sulfolobaceae TaxID=118883 RepID=UPI000845C5B5|nr:MULTISPECIES: nickel-dependent hydrogenase large subunit [unclassified Sulfolobus]AOL15438.1 Ni Fe-hydrogenase I large subunit [Sulfolobus sp. A20]TRM76969.1 Ni Fe-hydrogenase I large subunit [Sulfolobus sp. A20-N-F8]TRM96967.1 Ni Fe-hydrogenase I large subunit [Sulfolobus sp. B1]